MSNVSIFSIPKPWIGEIDVIQKNALRSWKELNCEIGLMGNDKGTKEASEKFKVKHFPKINSNERGTPLFDSMMYTMNNHGDKVILYTNADIILSGDIEGISDVCHNKFPKFLAVGSRMNVEIKRELNFKTGWLKRIKNGRIQSKRSRDYFMFPKNTFKEVPSFAIGRGRWDSWLVGEALLKNIPVIDLSNVITCMHQNHNFDHIPNGKKIKRGAWGAKGPEFGENKSLIGKNHPCNGRLRTTHEVVRNGSNFILRKAPMKD